MLMDYNSIDFKLKMLDGEAVEVNKMFGEIKPLTLREIIKYGYTDYLIRLRFLSLDLGDFLGEKSVDKDVNLFDVLVHFGSDDIHSELAKSLGLFLRRKVRIDAENHIIVVGDNERIITRENYETVIEIIKWQNCINKFGESELQSGQEESDLVKKIKDKLNKSRKIVEKVKSKENDGEEGNIDLYDIISSVSTKSQALNKLNIFDLTIFQLYDEFRRLDLIDKYELSIKSALAGAKDVKITHWSSKVNW